RPGVGLDRIDCLLNLIDAFLPVVSGLLVQRELRPASPLVAINGSQLPVFVSPVVPNRGVLSQVVVNVGGSTQKPEQLPRYAIEQHLFSREKRKALSEVVLCLEPKGRNRPGTGAILSALTVCQYVSNQFQVCFHMPSFNLGSGADIRGAP